MRILLVSPYDALSHRFWREGLVAQFPEHEFEVIALPPRYFNWRFRGNSLTLAHDPRVSESFDLLLATSMTDLSALKGMHRGLARIPSIVYFHENQFAYPSAHRDIHGLERQMTSLYTAIAADRVIFNSRFNQQTFFEGVEKMLVSMPDQVPAGIVARLEAKSGVLPVPLTDDCFQSGVSTSRFGIVWNHRWEFDKGPCQLLDIIRGLVEKNPDFDFHLLGQQFRKVPEAMKASLRLLTEAGSLGNVGFLSRPEYLAVLARSHVVLSTALHEFQGLGVLEAMAGGCQPVVPDALVYPELIEAQGRYGTPEEAVARIANLQVRFSEGEIIPAPDVDACRWSNQRQAWCAMLKSFNE